MISIVIVSLNTKNNLNKTIKSILHQTSKKFEIIIIDGNYSDGSINLIKKYKKHFSKIIIEKDKGIYDAMNKGIKISNKPWIIFLNSGDTFYNKFVIQNLRLIFLELYPILPTQETSLPRHVAMENNLESDLHKNLKILHFPFLVWTEAASVDEHTLLVQNPREYDLKGEILPLNTLPVL